MAKKPSPEKPAPSSLLPGFQHLIPSAAAAPLAAHIRPLFLPDLVQQIARNKQINTNRREQAHPAFRKWAKDLKQGVLQQLHETQVEQDFNNVLLRGLGYTTQSDVASDQPWTLTPKWNVPGSGEVEAALGKFRLDESGCLSGEPLVMVELKGAKVDLDRKMPTRNITPVQQVWNYLNASESAQWAIVCNYAEIRLYSRQKSSNHLHRVFLTELDDPDKFAEFYAIFHADSLLGTGMFAQNTGWLLREMGERQEKVSVELYREYADRRVELIQELRVKRAKGATQVLAPGRRGWPLSTPWQEMNGSQDRVQSHGSNPPKARKQPASLVFFLALSRLAHADPKVVDLDLGAGRRCPGVRREGRRDPGPFEKPVIPELLGG